MFANRASASSPTRLAYALFALAIVAIQQSGLRWRAHPRAHGDGAEGWLYRTAVRAALDAWRRDMRWARVRRLLAHVGGSPRTSEALHAADPPSSRPSRCLTAPPAVVVDEFSDGVTRSTVIVSRPSGIVVVSAATRDIGLRIAEGMTP